MARTSCGLPSIQADTVRGGFQQRQLHSADVQDPSVGAARGCDETLLGGQDPGRGEQLGSGNRVHAGTVDPTQHPRLADAVVSTSQGDRLGVQHLGHEQLDQLLDLVGGNLYGPDLALCFGADMPALPGRTVFLHRLQHLLRRRRHPLRIHGRGLVVEIGLSAWLIIGLDRVRSAERFDGLDMPGGTLLGQRAGFVLGVPGFQGGLLRQLQRLHRRRRPTMITLKPRRQFTLPVLDQHPPRRPTLVQRRSTPTISRTGRLPGSVSGRSANRTPSRSRR